MIARLTFAFGLLVALGALGSAEVVAETTTGGVYVTTLPGGADVWVDGTYVGRSPVLVDALSAGKHAITLTKTGWALQEVSVDVPASSVAMSSTRLLPGPQAFAGTAAGTLVVRGSNDASKLILDGGRFPGDLHGPIPLPAGPHRITFVTPRGKTSRTFTVFPDTPTGVVLSAPRSGESRSAVVAPASDYLPDGSFSLEGTKIVVRYEGHVVVAHLGDPSVRYDGADVAYDGSPLTIGGKLYLPLALLEKLTDDMSKGR